MLQTVQNNEWYMKEVSSLQHAGLWGQSLQEKKPVIKWLKLETRGFYSGLEKS